MQLPRLTYGMVAAAIGLSGCATPPPASPALAQGRHFTVDYAALGGRTGEINHWVALNGDCSGAGLFTVQVVTPPAHGQAEVARGQFFPRYRKLEPQGGCDTVQRDGVALRYTPAAGYAGPDHLAISVVTPEGRYWTTDVNIVVPPQQNAVATAVVSQPS